MSDIALFTTIALKDNATELMNPRTGKSLRAVAEGVAALDLPEIDPDFTDGQIVLAFLKDGQPLDTKEGPYRIVIPEEKRTAGWVKQVTTLTIANVR